MSNELKLSLENFQSITHGELIFHTGTTVIIGQSNSGKTATFRGLKACLSNPSGSQRFIKNGTKQAVVTLEYNGNQISWRRTPKESTYQINGETYYKTGNSNAFKILEDTGFVRDDNDTLMNIEEELQLPFPFGVSKSELFKLFENVFCVSDSAVILKSAKEQEDKVKGDITIFESELAKNKNKLKELEDFENFVNIPKLEKMQKFLKAKKDRIDFLKDGNDIIKKAVKVDKLSFEGISKEFKNLKEEHDELIRLKKDIQKLKNIHILNKEIPLSIEIKNNLSVYTSLLNTKKEIEILNKINNFEVPEYTIENKLEKYQNLITYLKTLKDVYSEIKRKKEKIENINSSIQHIEEKLKDFDVCPLCHQPLRNKKGERYSE